MAERLGVSRVKVVRSVRRLQEAGYLGVSKRWGQRKYGGRTWMHNVYELLEPIETAVLGVIRITRQAHARKRAAGWAKYWSRRAMNTKGFKSGGQPSITPEMKRCDCGCCRWREPPQGREPPKRPFQVPNPGLYRLKMEACYAYERLLGLDRVAALALASESYG